MLMPQFTVRAACWQTDRAALQAVRRAVFIQEQHVPEELEWDEMDAGCQHALAISSFGVPIGTGRLLPDARVGRMAVDQAWRGRGVGSTILRFLVELARQRGHAAISLHAQVHALDFYARHGFKVCGHQFMEAGIPHRAMTIRIEAALRREARPPPR